MYNLGDLAQGDWIFMKSNHTVTMCDTARGQEWVMELFIQ